SGGTPEEVSAVPGGWLVRGEVCTLETERWHPDHFRARTQLGEIESFVGSPEEVNVSCTREGLNREHTFRLVPPPPLPRRAHTASEGATAITAPLSGTIAAVRVTEGDAIETGQALVLLEAMKMEHRIVATADGTVRSVLVKAGDV